MSRRAAYSGGLAAPSRAAPSVSSGSATASAPPLDRSKHPLVLAYSPAVGLNELVGAVGKLPAQPAAGQHFHDRYGDPAGGIQRLPGLAEGERAG
jgi:hypothetical protein